MFTDNKNFWLGFGLAGLGSVLFSAKAIVAKLLYLQQVDALVVMGFRMLLALPFFMAIAIYFMRQVRKGLLSPLSRKQKWQVVSLGFIGYYLSSYLDFLGLQYITAGLERLILFLSPTFVLLITAVWLKRPIVNKQWFALGLSYIGVFLVFLQDLSLEGDHVVLGTAFVFCAALTYSIYLIGSGELVRLVGPTRLVAYAMTTSCFITQGHFLITHSWQGLQQNAVVYGLSLWHAVAHTVIPTIMMMWAIARIGAPMVAQLGLLGPVSVLFLAAWVLGEPITAIQLLGTGVTLAGAVVLGRR